MFKTPPYDHQLEALRLSEGRKSFAFFMEQGTGKTKVVLDDVARLFRQSKVDGLLVIAPNGIHLNWAIEEIPKHLPDDIPHEVLCWISARANSVGFKADVKDFFNMREEAPILKILLMNIEATGVTARKRVIRKFLDTRKTYFAIDESTQIKTPSAKRTQTMIAFSRYPEYKRILSGFPFPHGPFDAFAQFKFLDPEIWDTTQFAVFKQEYAEFERVRTRGGQEFEQVVQYLNVDRLQSKIDPYMYRVLKKDCLDLPEKIYTSLFVDLSPRQLSAYKIAREEIIAELMILWNAMNGADDDLRETAQTVYIETTLARQMKLRQILSGFIIPEAGADPVVIDPKPPRIEAILEHVDESEDKFIVWACFRYDVELLMFTLKQKYGPNSTGAYYGGTKTDDRIDLLKRFQDLDDPLRFFIGNPQSAGLGLTLTAAHNVFYYSCSPNLEHYIQSEDRPHRIGQTHAVLYRHMIAQHYSLPNGTVDLRTIAGLRGHREMGEMLLNDPPTDWL